MVTMKQCVIFDMDGVIVDSEPLHQACERKMFHRLGIQVSAEEHDSLVGSTDETMWLRLSQAHSLPVPVEEAVRMKKELYLEFIRQDKHFLPVPLVRELMEDLFQNDCTMALASSSPHEQIRYIIDRFDMGHFFSAIVSGEDVDEGKPHPGIFLKAAEAVGVEPRSCLVIEDSKNGVTAALSAGMKCVGFSNPNSGNQDLSQAHRIIHSFDELKVGRIRELIGMSF